MNEWMNEWCLAQTKVFASLAIHMIGFGTEYLNQAQFNLRNCTLSVD